jgi:hypothetical protein
VPELPHLILPRVESERPRKKTGYGRPPARDHRGHGELIRTEVETVLDHFRSRRPPQGINPNLILRIKLNPKSIVEESIWERSGLTLLSVDKDKTLVLFSSDQDLVDFRRRLAEYQGGPSHERQKTAPHSQIFANIDGVGEIRPMDRIGRLLKSQGMTDPTQFLEGTNYVIDLELWDLGTRELCEAKLNEIENFIMVKGGRVTDRYNGESLVLMRVKCDGAVIRQLLEIDNIATIDLPPQPTITIGKIFNLGVENFPPIQSPPEGSPGIAVIDSGLTPAHPFLSPALGEAAPVPNSLGDPTDGHGHGTMVAGLALYGDVEHCIQARAFVPQLTLYSARVLNDQCRFDDENLITSQMQEAIRYFASTYNCRVFNISLGDARLPYHGGKVSPWASILDVLARELNVVITVSAGNYCYDPGPGNSPDTHVHSYPRYLLKDEARIIEPATGAIVLTVGSLAHTADVPPGSPTASVSFRPIALAGQPSPFTRSGPGLADAIKPEFSEFGGNYAYDGAFQSIRDDIRELSIVSFNRDYLTRLFTTDVGTSFAAPRVAHMAARLFESFPDASANLIRALLAASAVVPQPSLEALQSLGEEAILRVCGYGKPNLEHSQTSDENRVVLYGESALGFDNFHIYEVPIPEEFTRNAGTRSITVTLAFDPPVRHSRFDYLGVKMSFRLIRGKTPEEIVEAFRQRSQEEEFVDRLTSTSFDCPMAPKPGTRENSTLQRAVFRMKQAPRTDYGDTYYLVVRCERKWAREEHTPQRYAVVVMMEHSAAVNIYHRIRQRVTVRLQAQRTA